MMVSVRRLSFYHENIFQDFVSVVAKCEKENFMKTFRNFLIVLIPSQATHFLPLSSLVAFSGPTGTENLSSELKHPQNRDALLIS